MVKSDYNLVTLSRLVETACNDSNYSQLVTVPTRFQYNRGREVADYFCIDHVYANKKLRCSNITVTPFGGSDHDIVGYTRLSKVPPEPARTIRKRSYKNFVQEDFLRDMRDVDWSEVYVCQDVDVSTEILTRKIVDVLNIHAPWVVFQKRKYYAPWISKETKEMIKSRDNWKKVAEEFTKVGDVQAATAAWSKFKQTRNTINNRKKFEDVRFQSEQLSNIADSPAKTWNTVKSFMNWKHSGGPPHQLSIGGKMITKSSIIAKEMNRFFMNKVKAVRESITFLPNSFSQYREIMKAKRCRLTLNHVSVQKVNKLLKSLKNTKSLALDELDNFCIKLAADILDKPVHHIITMSIMQSKFPRSWKLSKVIPLHKKLCPFEMKNYRPVSILSPLSKILEKVVYEQLYDYMSRNKIFHQNLHGYRQHRSTQTALLTMYDRWVKAAAAGQVSGAVLLDLSAAFDLVDPELLVKKLRIYGLDEEFLGWIHSYLACRYQAVWLDHTLSEFLLCEVGVPQGSNLGPIFFMIFFNDLLFSLGSDVDNYADDTTITATGKSVDEIGIRLTSDCEKVSDWMRSNKLKLNPDKTHIMTMGTTERLRILPSKVQVTMDDVELKEDDKNTELLLGCHIQANLKWNTQIENLQRKLSKRITGLMKIRLIASYKLRKTITEGLFNSVLVYCLPLFGGMSVNSIRQLQIMQHKAARM